MSSLKMAFHSTTGRRMVEVYDDADRLVAAIYPDTNGVKIISKYRTEIAQDERPPASITVTFKSAS